MFEDIELLFKKLNIHSHKNQGITVANVSDSGAGIELAAEILHKIVDGKSVLYLSGGSLKTLYEKLAKEEILAPGAVGLIDERYGPPFHNNSNQLMVRDSGFLRYLEIRDIPFYPILIDKPREETAESYDGKIRELNAVFPKSIGLLGIGPDGHTSSLAPNRHDFKNPMFDPARKHLLVSEFDDQKSHYKERVGMTFLGLAMLDVLIVPVFGENKKEALNAMFEEGSEYEIPARFFKRPDIAKKILLITDLTI